MIRYAKQRDRRSCAPVSIINMLKYFGLGLSLQRDLPLFQLGCKTNDRGSSRYYWGRTIAKVARAHNIQWIFKDSPSLTEMEILNKDGWVFLMTVDYIEDGRHKAHCIFIPKITKKSVEIVNRSRFRGAASIVRKTDFDTVVIRQTFALKFKN